MSIEAMKQALEALRTLHDENMDYFTRNKLGGENNQCMVFARETITVLRQAIDQAQQAEPVTVLPDGSAFAMMSWPLPKDHWLYAEREYSDGEYEPVELGKPILTHELRKVVVSAVRYAIRGATNCGKEVDFDPDALVQNAVYALCGPYTSPVATNDTSQERVDETAKQQAEQDPIGDVQDRLIAERAQMQPCAGRNCGSTNPNLHSAECFEDYENSTGMVTKPVAWGVFDVNLHDMFFTKEEARDMARLKGDGSTVAPLYTAPPPRQPWASLTDEEMKQIQMQSWNDYPDQKVKKFDAWKCLKLAEAKLKEKNT